MKSCILVFDPGENTGWVAEETTEEGAVFLYGGTAVRDHRKVAELFDLYNPTMVVFERFNLYPGMAKTMSWNSFYPCEVIGVIRYLCQSRNIPFVEQAPSIKKYSGGLDERWVMLRRSTEVTEHTKDAYLHLKYYLRNSRHSSCSSY